MSIHPAPRLLGADVHLTRPQDPAALAQHLDGLLEGSPFRLLTVDDEGTCCRFVAAHPDLALTWRNVVDLQWRIGGSVDIAEVVRLDDTVAGLALAGV
jgi:hypothetical protein